MPYYDEQFIDRPYNWNNTTKALPGNGIVYTPRSGIGHQQTARIKSFRTRPHRNALLSTEIPDLVADPYASFLKSNSERKLSALLAERGLEAKGKSDNGHSFDLARHTWTATQVGVRQTVINGSQDRVIDNLCHLIGPGISDATNAVFSGGLYGPATYKETGFDSFAKQAYARKAPTMVEFNAATFFGELLEGLPKLVPETLVSLGKDLTRLSTRKRELLVNRLRSSGSDYLNVQFGWLPMISDVQRLAKALFMLTQQLRNIERSHRSFGIPEIVESGSWTTGSWDSSGFIGSIPGFLTTEAQLKLPTSDQYTWYGGHSIEAFNTGLSKVRRVRRWFEGEFSLFLPLGFDPEDYLQKANLLINLKASPDVLWELAPFSWLVDWYLHIGDAITAAQAAANDLLIMHYGYAMESTQYITTQTFNLRTSGSFPYSNVPKTGMFNSITEYKKRIRANPYGFANGGATALSGNQLAILGALGLTKAK